MEQHYTVALKGGTIWIDAVRWNDGVQRWNNHEQCCSSERPYMILHDDRAMFKGGTTLSAAVQRCNNLEGCCSKVERPHIRAVQRCYDLERCHKKV